MLGPSNENLGGHIESSSVISCSPRRRRLRIRAAWASPHASDVSRGYLGEAERDKGRFSSLLLAPTGALISGRR